MGLFNVIKRKEVPAELPDLSFGNSLPKTSQPLPKSPSPKMGQAPQQSILNRLKQNNRSAQTQNPQAPETNRLAKFKPLPVQNPHQSENADDNGAGFFRELMNDLTKEIDESKLDKIYKDKVLSGDMVFQMKEYWQKQNPEMLLKNVGSDLKEKLLQKTNKLHELEKEWQDAYFTLTSTEDSIRQEEKDLKQLLSELMDLYQRSLKNSREEKTEKKK